MATKYNVAILVNDEWDSVGLFSDAVPMRAMIRFANCLLDEMEDCEDVAITDMDTGNFVAICDEDGWNWQETESSEDDWDIDEASLEMGFNPYLGDYDYDC